MKTIVSILLATALLQSAQAGEGFALVELFTSEGCSSCPPADKLLAEIVAEAGKKKRPVHGVAFHVDYWNQLGWKDSFSAPAWTQRQQAYSQQFKLRSVYTPQMIVNGTVQFVGANRSLAATAIEKALARPAPMMLTMQPTGECKITPAGKGVVIHVALVENGLSRNVTRGENAGKKLVHTNVVRTLATTKPDASGAATVKIPSLKSPNQKLIGWVQDTGTGKILGATTFSPTPPRSAGVE